LSFFFFLLLYIYNLFLIFCLSFNKKLNTFCFNVVCEF
jgi:hypothetical protein